MHTIQGLNAPVTPAVAQLRTDIIASLAVLPPNDSQELVAAIVEWRLKLEARIGKPERLTIVGRAIYDAAQAFEPEPLSYNYPEELC